MIRQLLMLNGVAITGVVTDHAIGWAFIAMFWWTDRCSPGPAPYFSRMGGLQYYVLRLAEQPVMVAILAFLFVSGHFVSVATGRTQHTLPCRTVFTMIGTLLVPYLHWSLLLFASDYVQGIHHSIVDYFRPLLIGGADQSLYFVPVIIQPYLLSPLLVRLARNWAETTIVDCVCHPDLDDDAEIHAAIYT